MSIFQSSVVTKYLKTQNKEKIAIQWNLFKNHFLSPKVQEDIRNLKEEQYQGEFLEDFFVKILGYTKPASSSETKCNLTTEYKNIKDSKKADGAIIVNNIVKAVIELKGTNTTDLGKIEAQAFGYKNNQPECTYVITSNFEKLRFYIDNAIEHIEFNLFTLTEKDFELLYLCLAYENIEKNIPKKLKEESLSQEDAITKKLYNDYSLFKRELHQSLVILNPQFDPLTLFQKSQKLLDRFLFLFFAEDRQLLPPNSVRLILDQWQKLKELDAYTPLFDRFKKYFGYLNTGHKGKQYDVYAYNGGLFLPDEVLDTITIDDDLLYKHTLKLSGYDFISEVDVNILGHIFENSLNELDEIKAQLDGQAVDKSKTKRKKDGVFYTPKYITKYIVENTVGKLCEEKKAELEITEEEFVSTRGSTRGLIPLPKKKKQQLLEKLSNYRNWLLQLTICDPACGSGAFLNQTLDFLISEHRYIDELQAKLFGDAMVLSDVEKGILENNLFGVDLNEESVEIAKLSLWLRTAQPNRKLNDLNNNIKCGNSLIDDVEVAGEKAFNWQKEFPQIFKEKNKKAFHITTAVHDSRTSERMIEYKVREKRDLGTNPYPNISYFTEEDEFVITQTIANIVKEDNLNVLAYNICADHIHLLLVCEEENVPIIMQRIKGKTARAHNSNKGINPLVQKENEKSVSLWTQKFGCKEITTEAHLFTAIDYIKHNRSKHNLPQHSNKGFKPLVESINCSYEHAFRQEYKGGFDVVIGNPPYVDNRGFDKKELAFLYGKYSNSFKKSGTEKFKTTKLNLIAPFIELNKNILKNKGLTSFIFHKNIFKTNSYTSIREFILREFNILQLTDWGAGQFQDVIAETATFVLKKEKLLNTEIKVDFFNLSEKYLENYQSQNSFLLAYEYIFGLYANTKDRELLEKIEFNSVDLEKFVNVNNGIVTGNDSKYLSFEKSTINSKKVIRGKDIKKYSSLKESEYVDYIKTELLRARDENIFLSEEKLLMQMINIEFVITYDNQQYYNLGTTYAITNKNSGLINLKFLMSILNSGLIRFYYLKKFTNESSLTNAISTQNLFNIPIKQIAISEQAPFIEKAEQMLSLNKELQEQSQKFQRTLEREFFDKGFKPLANTANSLPKKLQDWYLLSFGDFIKELEKKKVKLSLSQKAEWEDYFLQESKKALVLKTNIDTTDKEIDAMVYELYGLNEEEISIIEKS